MLTNKTLETMKTVYLRLIKEGAKTLAEVPDSIRADVEVLINQEQPKEVDPGGDV